ncbi:UvrD-helicase domain-containing protein, partial [Escherichia coli]|uniref:UvrD-helicase domain-containing protein n=1 Tax=Escherichia coli TaxID=562 RepID=UPI003CE59467
SASVFVRANAGSGKTKVLVDRVARLLLEGAAPDAIICITFTKAAAAEMQTRLFDRLGSWSVLSDADLSEKLA